MNGRSRSSGGEGLVGFLNGIPLWVYILVIVLGLAIGTLLIILSARARKRPGPGTGTAALVFGILSLILLALVPLVLMLIAQPWSERDRGRDRLDREERFEEEAEAEPGDVTWRVRFVTGADVYEGQFEPRNGSGIMKILYTLEGREVRARERCTLTGTRQIRITCTNPEVLSGNADYVPDNFDLTWDGGDVMTGTISAPGSAGGTATFTRGSDPRFEGAAWEAPIAALPNSPGSPTGPAAGDLSARLAAAVAQQRARLPIRSGPTTVTAIEAIGTRVNMFVTIAENLGPNDWVELEQVLRSSTCSGPYGNLIRMGASISYEMLDSAEEQRSLAVTSC